MDLEVQDLLGLTTILKAHKATIAISSSSHNSLPTQKKKKTRLHFSLVASSVPLCQEEPLHYRHNSQSLSHTHSLCLSFLSFNNGDGYAKNQRHRRWGIFYLFSIPQALFYISWSETLAPCFGSIIGINEKKKNGNSSLFVCLLRSSLFNLLIRYT